MIKNLTPLERKSLLLNFRKLSTISSASLCFIARKKGVDKKLIRLMVHEDICYFSYKLRKQQFLSKAMQEK